ncbi:hypothetical protein [Paenarthrobacter ilicis]|uniref:hypothetical protein n=1 Tax=Paenarthrobacter ilicis TaxID=43665 RepID=UPI003869C8E6
MRKSWAMAVPLVMLLVGCTAPSPQPTTAGPTPQPSVGSTASASQPPSDITSQPATPSGPALPTQGPAADRELSGADEPGRYAYLCTSLDASPEVQLSSLAEVWAATNYTRMASCDVSFQGDQPFEPTPAEKQAITTAAPDAATPEQGLAAMLDVMRLCTRISDETGPGGFKEAARETLTAAAAFCPDAPQARIIAEWADGTRTGAGQ